MAKQNQALLQRLPSVDSLLETDELKKLAGRIPRKVIVDAVRTSIEQIRESIVTGSADKLIADEIGPKIIADVRGRITDTMKPYYRRVINATGIILHTALGRAVLSEEALEQIREELGSYSLLQVDVETGKRSQRDIRIEQLMRLLTGAQAATVVNNNAAATAIVLNTVAKGKEVIVSRGQLVEIGGSFRLPDVMAFSGAKLVEVGTTNKTHPQDYVNAITENTAAILRVHPSNYKIQGFSSEVPLEKLVCIARSNNLVVIDDVGAGALIDFSKFGFEYEPTLADSIAKGADIVTSSADKLIGASQGGIILGRDDLVKAVRKNQFARIVRIGKLTLAALEATLMLFLDESKALGNIPTLQMLSRDEKEIAKEAKQIASKLDKVTSTAEVTTVPGYSQTGSGSLPSQNLATTLVAISSEKISAEDMAIQLRCCNTPVFARIQKEKILIDPRTLRDGDEKILIKALLEILTSVNA